LSTRELIALGTSSQVPTRERNHNACMLRWDGAGFLFDPGEGTQRQFTIADIPACAVHTICITHFHGDHCLGLPGVVQRFSLDHCEHPVHVYYPESGREYFERLCNASIYHSQAEVVGHPIGVTPGEEVEIVRTESYVLSASALDHVVPTLGYRLAEHPGRRFLPEKLESAGIHGPMVGQLEREGTIVVNETTVAFEDVTTVRPGNVFAFVMDTRPCAGAEMLARDADLLVMEATYTAEHQDLAVAYGHSSAADAARTALSAGARRLALTHFSQRYSDLGQHLDDAKSIFPDVVVLRDLDRVLIPRRR
jgi:ribonuclease Z